MITLSSKFSQQIKSAILSGIQEVKQNISGSETEIKIEYTIIWLKYISKLFPVNVRLLQSERRVNQDYYKCVDKNREVFHIF